MRRTTRSRATRLAVAAVVALFLAACGGSDGDGATEPPVVAGPTSDASATPTPTPTSPATTPTPDTTASPDATPSPDAAPAGDVTVEPEGQELALVTGAGVEILYTLPDEGESVFRAAAVRPGSTRDDLVVVVVTSAEGMYDLRWLEVTDGEVGELQLFPERYQLPSDLMTRMELVPVPVWSPDGRSVAWIVPAEDADTATLQTVGWSDGPGTGDTADDNAAFGLEVGSAEVQARDWTAGGGDRSILRVETADGAAFDVHLERQADGALALLEVTPAA